MRKKAAGKEKSVRWPSLILGSLLNNRVRERLLVTKSETRHERRIASVMHVRSLFGAEEEEKIRSHLNRPAGCLRVIHFL